jgi:hypothetical protein
MEATSYNMMTFIVILLIMFFIAFIPALFVGEDNKHLYFNVPLSRMAIYKQRYLSMILFFIISLVILYYSIYTVDYIYSKIGLSEHETYDIYMVFGDSPLGVFLVLFTFFNITFTLYHFKDLVSVKFRTLLFYVFIMIIFFYSMFLFASSLLEEVKYWFVISIVNVLIIAFTLIINPIIFRNGEV